MVIIMVVIIIIMVIIIVIAIIIIHTIKFDVVVADLSFAGNLTYAKLRLLYKCYSPICNLLQ